MSDSRNDPVTSRTLAIDEAVPVPDVAAPSTALGEAAVSGSLWTAMQVVVAKMASLGGTVVLMHLLAPDTFGVATLALSTWAMLTVLPPITMGDVLVARSADLDRIAGTAQRLCLLTSIVFALAIAASGPLAAGYYRSPMLVLACALVALRPLSEWMVVLPLSRLRTQLRFRTISTVDAIGQAGAMLASVLMAWGRCGPASLLLPQIGFGAIRAWLFRRASPPRPSPPWLANEARPLFRRFTLSGLGQYVHGGLFSITPLIIGSFTGQREVGWYTMAFTMSAQINAVMGFGMGLVLQPIFAQMSHDASRQSAAFLKTCRVLAALAMPICLIQAALAPAVFRLFLPEKWTGAILLTQILSLGQAFFFSVNPAIGLLTAQGRFGTYMMWQTVQLVLVVSGMLCVGAVWRDSPLIPIVLVAGLYHAVSAPIGVWIGLRGRGASFSSCLALFLRPLSMAAVSVVPAAWLLSRVAREPAARDILLLVLLPIVSLVTFVILLGWLDRRTAEECWSLGQRITHRLRRRRAAAA